MVMSGPLLDYFTGVLNGFPALCFCLKLNVIKPFSHLKSFHWSPSWDTQCMRPFWSHEPLLPFHSHLLPFCPLPLCPFKLPKPFSCSFYHSALAYGSAFTAQLKDPFWWSVSWLLLAEFMSSCSSCPQIFLHWILHVACLLFLFTSAFPMRLQAPHGQRKGLIT